jgi:two-component system OmpR family sensor kinase
MKRYWIAFIPLMLGLIAALAMPWTLDSVPVLVFKADIGSTAAVIGVLITIICLAVIRGRDLGKKDSRGEIESARAAAEDSRRRFLRRLDHELKNPLTGLRAALVNLNETSGAERDRTFNNAQREVDRLAHLVADLRKLTELDERPFEQSPVNLNDLLPGMVEAAQSHPAYAERTINLNLINVPWPLPPVMGDHDLLGLAFYNLIENALKFTRAEDVIEVRAREENRWLIVEVADTGTGIPAEDLPRLFEELYRGANARGVDGSGLGLALVERIVRRHGGEIAVHSRADGSRGTVFVVRLPEAKN